MNWNTKNAQKEFKEETKFKNQIEAVVNWEYIGEKMQKEEMWR